MINQIRGILATPGVIVFAVHDVRGFRFCLVQDGRFCRDTSVQLDERHEVEFLLPPQIFGKRFGISGGIFVPMDIGTFPIPFTKMTGLLLVCEKRRTIWRKTSEWGHRKASQLFVRVAVIAASAVLFARALASHGHAQNANRPSRPGKQSRNRISRG